MSGGQGPDHGGHADHADRKGARRGTRAPGDGIPGYTRELVSGGDVGVGEGSREAAADGRGAALSPRRDRAELTRAASSTRAGAEFDAQSAMDVLGDAIVVVDSAWRVRYVNAPWER